jgi:hypothetical protein
MQPSSNQILNFLVELFSRLRTKKPKFFVYLQYLTAAMGAVTGLPGLLVQWGVSLPPAMTILENKFVAACSVGFFIASQLTTANPTATVTADGTVLKQTDPSKMPFTAQTEVKSAQDNRVPNSSATLAQIKK